MANQQLKEDNDSLKHINGYLSEQVSLFPQMVSVIDDFLKITTDRWRSLPADSFEKKTMAKAKALVTSTITNNSNS